MKTEQKILVLQERWRNRNVWRLSNGVMEAVLLPGGGHIAELRLASACPTDNCLWAAPWVTADPGDPALKQLAAVYGGPPAGAFLAAYTGHALCLDNFGMSSREEAAQGIPLHGEAAATEWQVAPTEAGCICRTELPIAELSFEREISLAQGSSVLFVRERIANRGPDREIHWVQHVSFGPPFLEPGGSSVHAPLDHAQVWPLGYDGGQALRGSATFEWPHGPAVDGSIIDLQLPFQRAGTGFVAGARVDPSREVAYIAALNWQSGVALIYCFRRKDFPWVAVWEENQARMAPPWNGMAQVRGMEFGTTPMPVGREAMRQQGALFDTPVARLVPAGSAVTARYLACIATVPSGWREITDVVAGDDSLTVLGLGGSRIAVAAPGLNGFLLQDTQ